MNSFNPLQEFKDRGYSVSEHNDRVILSIGSPEDGETIELLNGGSVIHYNNGSETYNNWILEPVVVANEIVYKINLY